MQQVLEIMRGLQQDMAESKLEQERMQADLDASHERNEELHRVNEELRQGLRNDRGRHGHDAMENHSPPREFSTPFSQEILDAVIPNTFAWGGVCEAYQRRTLTPEGTGASSTPLAEVEPAQISSF